MTSVLVKSPCLPDGSINLDLLFAEPRYWAVDIKLCSRLAMLTIEEATAVSLGIDPRFLEWREIKEGLLLMSSLWRKRLSMGIEARNAGVLSNLNKPTEYIAWAKRVGISFPTELETMFFEASRSNPTAKQKRYSALNEPADRESEILVRLLFDVGGAFYQFDPQKAKSAVVSQIVSASERQQDPLDHETVLGWLRYAARVRGQPDGLLPVRVQGTICRLLDSVLADRYGWYLRPKEKLRAAETKHRAVELHADLASAGTAISVEHVHEALVLMDEARENRLTRNNGDWDD